MKKSSGFWFGLILIIVGTLLLLDSMDVVEFSESFGTYWPVLLIVWGLSRLFRPTKPSVMGMGTTSAGGGIPGATTTIYPSTELNYIASRTTFGDYRLAVQSKNFSGGNIETTFGNFDLDLLGAQLADGDYSLSLETVFGNTVVQLPKDMPFAIFARTSMGRVRVGDMKGSSSLDYRSPEFDGARSRLRLLVKESFGNITIRVS
jgi:lia operon protein LiaF